MPRSTPTTAESPPDTEPAEAAPGQVVYRGEATYRVITDSEWEAAGVLNQATTQWDRGEGLSLDHFTAEALTVLKRDANFKFE